MHVVGRRSSRKIIYYFHFITVILQRYLGEYLQQIVQIIVVFSKYI